MTAMNANPASNANACRGWRGRRRADSSQRGMRIRGAARFVRVVVR
jgi:hypothetical protein